ncbi:MAG TPA: alternative ribosome rescue aminoacyl-tRNA hydrolase ArfB [Chitinophagaceae bacterium]|nr:alternative ribosome rescue aminoacyl-tRNA hydrolase ArfB [Chitinophagaceae bacterium]
MYTDISSELTFKTARSSGKGGQHVNKVETKVIACFNLEHSAILSPEQKERIRKKLGNRISHAGIIYVRSQASRSQAGNKRMTIRKINELVNLALIIPPKRIRSSPSGASIANRLRLKKEQSEKKQNRRSPF